jgi:hypothetical protein
MAQKKLVNVELASLKDLDKKFKEAQSNIQNTQSLVLIELGELAQKWNQTLGKIGNELKSYDQNFMTAWEMIDDLSKQLKNLGVTDTSQVDQYKGYLQGLNKTKSALNSEVIAKKNSLESKL